MEEIKWTRSYMEDLNRRLEIAGLPKLVLSNDGYVYKDELHKVLGIGIELEEEP